MELLLLWVFFVIAGGVALNLYKKAGPDSALALLLRPVGAVMMIGGLVFAFSSVRDFFNGIASSRWPAAEARLIYAQVIDERPWWYFVRTLPSRNSGYTRGRVSRLNVGYEYFVNGARYHSREISFGSEFDSAVHQRERFRHAKPLLARYDPAAPGRAVLDPGVTLGSTGALLLGGVVMLLGGRLVFVTFASRRLGDGTPGRRLRSGRRLDAGAEPRR